MEYHICKKPILNRYYTDVLDRMICESYYQSDAVKCSSCKRVTTKENPLPDGRYLCTICMGFTVKPGDSIETVKTSIENYILL